MTVPCGCQADRPMSVRWDLWHCCGAATADRRNIRSLLPIVPCHWGCHLRTLIRVETTRRGCNSDEVFAVLFLYFMARALMFLRVVQLPAHNLHCDLLSPKMQLPPAVATPSRGAE